MDAKEELEKVMESGDWEALVNLVERAYDDFELMTAIAVMVLSDAAE